jgi:hypothetical protein
MRRRPPFDKLSNADGFKRGRVRVTTRGGARPGAGRKPGSRNKRTVLAEVLPKLAAPDQQLPLYRLLDRIADETEDIRYRDALSIACLPYLHSRPVSNLTAKPPHLMSDEELKATLDAEIEHQRQLAKGRGHLQVVGKK